jgi:hypothetical protein
MAAHVCSPEPLADRGLEGKLEAAGWGLFFVWLGTAAIANVGWNAGFIGVGIIILLGQAARRYFGVRTQKLSILLGSFFILGGVWSFLAIQFTLAPVLCVIVGLALLVSAIAGKSHHHA